MGAMCNEEEDSSKRKKDFRNNSINTNQNISILENDVNSFYKFEKSYEKKNTYNNKIAIDTNILTSGGTKNMLNEYKKIKLLGQGSFGKVYLVKHKILKTNFAMKIIPKKINGINKEANLNNEINILRKLDHPNILKINDFYSTKNEYIMITEFCPEGELFYEIKNFAPFDEALAAWYMKQILSAVNYCHKNHIIHRDLKPENILITQKNKDGFNYIKIIDFGTAILFNKKDKKITGSIYYIAPEVISPERNYTNKCDVWSCGVIMYILLTGKPPFNGSSDEEILTKILNKRPDMHKYPWPIISLEAKDLLKKLLDSDIDRRISAEEALNHEWFKCKQVLKKDNSYLFKVKNPDIMLNNLINYRNDNALKSLVLAYLVHNNMQLNQVHEAIKLFNTIDLNGDGQISKEELYKGIESFLGIAGKNLRNKVDKIFNNIDIDHNGFIGYEEFIRAAVDIKTFLSSNFLKFAFDYFDRDKNGKITFDEVTQIFFLNAQNKKNFEAKEQLLKNFKELDLNGDGFLSFNEFISMTQKIIRGY